LTHGRRDRRSGAYVIRRGRPLLEDRFAAVVIHNGQLRRRTDRRPQGIVGRAVMAHDQLGGRVDTVGEQSSAAAQKGVVERSTMRRPSTAASNSCPRVS